MPPKCSSLSKEGVLVDSGGAGEVVGGSGEEKREFFSTLFRKEKRSWRLRRGVCVGGTHFAFRETIRDSLQLYRGERHMLKGVTGDILLTKVRALGQSTALHQTTFLQTS